MKSYNKYSNLNKISLTQDDFLTEKLNSNFKKLFNNIQSHSSDDDMKKLELKLVDILNLYKVKVINGEIKNVDETFI